MLLLLVSGIAYLKKLLENIWRTPATVEKDPKIHIQSANSYTTLDIMIKNHKGNSPSQTGVHWILLSLPRLSVNFFI